MRMTNVASVVRATAETGTKSVGSDRRTGQSTSGNIPELKRPSEFWTSSSTGIVRVFTSTEWAMRATVPTKVWLGNAETLKSTFVPVLIPAEYFSGTGTTSRNLLIFSTRTIGR